MTLAQLRILLRLVGGKITVREVVASRIGKDGPVRGLTLYSCRDTRNNMDTFKSFRLSKEQLDHLRKLKQQTGIPVSVIVRHALDAYLARYCPTPGGLGLVEKEQQADAD